VIITDCYAMPFSATVAGTISEIADVAYRCRVGFIAAPPHKSECWRRSSAPRGIAPHFNADHHRVDDVARDIVLLASDGDVINDNSVPLSAPALADRRQKVVLFRDAP